MIYIISGVSRSGKTILAKRMLNEQGIPYLSTDAVMMGFMNGVSEVDLHDKMWPDEIAQKLWGFLKHFILTMIHNEEDYLIEGEAFIPSLVKELLDAYPRQIKLVFIGYANADIREKIQDVKTHASKHDWLCDHEETFIEEHIQNMISYAKKIEKECSKIGLSYMDVSSDFYGSMEGILDYLKTR